MGWMRCCGGSSKKAINKNIALLNIMDPTPNSSAPTNRTFVKGSAVKGLSTSNYYYPNNILVPARPADNTVRLQGATWTGYSYGYVLPAEVVGGSTIHLKVTRSSDNCQVNLSYYASNGTDLGDANFMANGNGVLTKEGDVLVPANAEYIIVMFMMITNDSTTVDFTLDDISVQ